MNVSTAKVGVRVYPLASHNIDKAMLSGSKLQPCSRNIGRQTGGSMSMWRCLHTDKGSCSNSYRQALMDSTLGGNERGSERTAESCGRRENE